MYDPSVLWVLRAHSGWSEPDCATCVVRANDSDVPIAIMQRPIAIAACRRHPSSPECDARPSSSVSLPSSSVMLQSSSVTLPSSSVTLQSSSVLLPSVSVLRPATAWLPAPASLPAPLHETCAAAFWGAFRGEGGGEDRGVVSPSGANVGSRVWGSACEASSTTSTVCGPRVLSRVTSFASAS